MTGKEVQKELAQFSKIIYYHSKNHKQSSKTGREPIDDRELNEFCEKIILHYKNVKLENVKSQSRKGEFVEVRQMCMYMIKRAYPSYDLSYIGLYMGGRDHSTVSVSIDRVLEECDWSKGFKNKFENIKKALGLT